MRSRTCIITIVGALLIGCGLPVRQLTVTDSRQMREQSLVAISGPPSNPFVMTVARGAAGILGGNQAASAEGRDLVAQHSIPDPTDVLREKLVETLQQSLSMSVVGTASSVAEGDIQAVMSWHRDAKYFLDVRTLGRAPQMPNAFR